LVHAYLFVSGDESFCCYFFFFSIDTLILDRRFITKYKSTY